MEKLVMIMVLCLVLAGCGARSESLPAVPEQPGVVSAEQEVESGVSSCQAEAPEVTERTQGESPRMVMVDGVRYTYEKPCEELGRCGLMDGTITSTVNGVPTENGQSNFGTGYQYQFLGDAIDVYFPEKDEWLHFVAERTEHILFSAEVEALEDNWMIVRSQEGEWSAGERFRISRDYWVEESALKVGQVVCVECGDMVLETDPAQLEVYGVEPVADQ